MSRCAEKRLTFRSSGHGTPARAAYLKRVRWLEEL